MNGLLIYFRKNFTHFLYHFHYMCLRMNFVNFISSFYRCANTSRHTQIWTQSVQLSTFSHQRAKVKQQISITRSSSCVLVFECIFSSLFFLLLLLMLAGYGWYKYRIVHFFLLFIFMYRWFHWRRTKFGVNKTSQWQLLWFPWLMNNISLSL